MIKRYIIDVIPKVFHFKKPAGTSRGVYTERRSWFVRIQDGSSPCREGWGECAPLPGLSCDDVPEYENLLLAACREVEENGVFDAEKWKRCPSIVFGLETALQHLERGHYGLWDTPFSRGEQGIRINGLIWMGDYESMYRQIREKMDAGYRCVKLKIGAIDFEQELNLLRFVRQQFSAKDIELRVDANGAFSSDEALEKLKRLSDFDLHSIEQPIKSGQWDVMRQLTDVSPLDIALDEELIGWHHRKDKEQLLEVIKPKYLILKPSLHGGFSGCKEWIDIAEQRKIGWWITSALESNVGLNAIAQWCATWNPIVPQGLGTGLLFTDNVPMPLEIRKDALWYVAD